MFYDRRAVAIAYERRDYGAGGAALTTITAQLSSGDVTSFTLADATGWPDGTNGKFYALLDPTVDPTNPSASAELVLCDSRTGTSVDINATGRGQQGTSDTTHVSGSRVWFVHTLRDADEANYWVAELAAAISAAGDLAVGDGDNSLTTLANGTTGQPLVAGASTPAYAELGTAGVADDAVTNDKLANITRGSVKVGGALNAPTDLDAKTSGQILVGDGTDVQSVAVSGDATLASTGALTIAAGAVENTMLADGDTVGVAETADAVMGKWLYFSRSGTLTTGTGTMPMPILENITILGVRAHVGTAPTGAAVIVDVHLDGTTIFTTQTDRPEIAISGTESATEVPAVTSATEGQQFTCDVDQVGSTVAGADLVVGILVVPA